MTETRSFSGRLEVRAGGDGRTVTGLVAPFYTPTPIGGRFVEMFEPGSFRLDEPVRLHAGHPQDSRDMPVSPAGRLWEQRDGVAAEWHLSRTSAADDLLALITDRAVSGLSVGFSENPSADRWSQDRHLVTRRGARLLHVAVVEKPAYTGAQVTGVRAALSGESGGRVLMRVTPLAALEILEHRRQLDRWRDGDVTLDSAWALRRLARRTG